MRNLLNRTVSVVFLSSTLVLTAGLQSSHAQERPTSGSPASAEREDRSNVYVDPNLHSYMDADDELVIEGVFKSLQGATVEITNLDGQVDTFKLNEFSDEDQKFIRSEAVRQRKFERNEEETLKIIQRLNSADAATLVKAINRLRGFGRAAHKAVPLMRSNFVHPDKRVKRAAFVAFAHCCDPTTKNLKTMIKEMNDETWGMKVAFDGRMRDFLNAMTQFGDPAWPYLQHVAFTGRVKTRDNEPSSKQNPIQFDVTEGQVNQYRAAACEAMAKYPDEQTLDILHEILPLAEKKLGDKQDEITMKAVLNAFGEIGIINDDVTKSIVRLKKVFPKEAERAISKIKRANRNGKKAK